MKKAVGISICLMLAVSLPAGCSNGNQEKKAGAGQGVEPKPGIILATTTSTQDSGLLDYLLPIFTNDTGIEVRVVAVGSGKAIQMGKDGEADILLVHSRDAEEEFIKEGHGLVRHDVMYNDFVMVGPDDDPLKLKEKDPNDIVEGLKIINDNKFKFISRGDESGTHTKEKSLWKAAGIQPDGDFYVSAGKGMGEVMKMADEMKAYTIADRATFLNLKDKLELKIVIEKDDRLFNQYGVIPVNPNKNNSINSPGATEFMNWILSKKVQDLIRQYGVDKYGEPLFTPNGK